ncbi:MAG: 50S ribosomal protein L2 [Alphaproteobacteria bacterium]|nr:50S ribosomal protein L2 [Alphaproteobacteria bacterium]
MALKQYNPTSPGQRGLISVDRSELYKGKPVKKLTEGLTKTGGRNNSGHVTAWQKGGGHKRRYRLVDFKRRKMDMMATVDRIEYDPNRTAFIALITYEDGEQSYILAPQRLAAGDKVISIIHNVELKAGKGGQMARSAGTYVQLIGRDQSYSILRLASGEVRMVRSECMATIGAVSNSDQQNIKLGKAGRSRWLGRRPHVRGVAMNPIDHPHGGGEGKTSGGRHPVTPWGKPTKGKRTRNNKKTDRLIVRRRKA